MIVWWRVLYLSQMILFAMKPPCICKCVFDHSFFYVFDRFLYLFLCLLTIPCVFVSFDHSLYLVAQVLPHWLLVWAGATHVDASALFANCRPPSLSVAQCGQEHKYKNKNTWMWNTIWHLCTLHNVSTGQWVTTIGFDCEIKPSKKRRYSLNFDQTWVRLLSPLTD